LQDILFSIRSLRRSPTFALVGVLVLALGLGATFTVFTIVDTVLIRSLPYKDPDRLVKAWETSSMMMGHSWVAPGNFRDWSRDAKSFSGMAAYNLEDFAVVGQGDPKLVRGVSVSPTLFSILGVRPLLGRGFAANETEIDNGRVVLIGEGFWRRELGADPAVIGRVLTVAAAPYKVIGVLPSSFDFPSGVEMWRPLVLTPQMWAMRGGHFLEVVARLRRGVSMEQASAEMRAMTAHMGQLYPETNAGAGASLVPLREELTGKIRPALLVLSGAVDFVLLAVCANLVCLLLARNASRQRETAIRLALGASRGRVIRQLCTEAILLTLAGGAIGLLIANWALNVFSTVKPFGLNSVGKVSLDAEILGLGLLLSLMAGLLSGLVPALLAARQASDESLAREGERTSGTRRSRRIQSAFVISQITLALVLSVGAGLLARSFGLLQRVSPGFDPSEVVALTVTLPETVYGERPQQSEVFRRIVEQVRELPVTESAAVVSTLPLSGEGLGFEISVEGRPAAKPNDSFSAAYDAVSPDYFKVLRIPLRQGRGFTERDNASAPGVALINQTLASRLWPGENPIGQRVTIGDRGPNPREVVGVIADVLHNGLDSAPRAEIYVPQAQVGWSVMTLVVRSKEAPEPLLRQVRQAIWSIDRTLPVSQEAPLRKVIAKSVSQRWFNALLLSLFAGLAVVLAVLGLYGLLTQAVIDRRREIGIRMALGAAGGSIQRQVLIRGLLLAAIGLAIGIPAALFLSRVLEGMLYQVSASDPWTIAAVSLVVLAVSLISSFLPAARAVRVDPLISMRGD
jgi:putative ABC transport system permease protein